MTHRHDLAHDQVPRRPFSAAVVRMVLGPDAADERNQQTAWMLGHLLARMVGIVRRVEIDAPAVACKPALSPFSRQSVLVDHVIEGLNELGLATEAGLPRDPPDFTIGIGEAPLEAANVYAAGTSWTGAIATRPIQVGPSEPNPVGPFTAACLAAAEAFKAICGANPPPTPEFHALDVLAGIITTARHRLQNGPGPRIPTKPVYVVGCGAVGQAALVVLTQFPALRGVSAIDQPDPIDATNLNRYLLATSKDVGKGKASTATNRIRSNVPWPIHSRDTGWTKVRQAYGANLGTSQFERELEALERTETFPIVLSGVDSGAARRNIQRAIPGDFVQGNTQGLQLQVRNFDLTDPAAECGACRARSIRDDELMAKLRKLPLTQRQEAAQAAGIPPNRIEAFLGPECAGLGEEEKEMLRPQLDGQEFSVSFVSALAGFAAAAQALSPIRASTSACLFYNFWENAGVMLPIRRDPSCECGTGGYHAFHAAKWTASEVGP